MFAPLIVQPSVKLHCCFTMSATDLSAQPGARRTVGPSSPRGYGEAAHRVEVAGTTAWP